MKTIKNTNAPHDPNSRATRNSYSSLDDLIRRALKVSDPANADEIVEALLKLYPAETKWVTMESVSLAELRDRRDAVINSLLVLVGTGEGGYSADEWPRGLKAYKELIDRLSNNAQCDLRPLLQASEITSLMDELIQQCSGGTSVDKTVISSSSKLSLNQLQRLRTFGWMLVSNSPFEPLLASFVLALELFLYPFDFCYGKIRLDGAPIKIKGLSENG